MNNMKLQDLTVLITWQSRQVSSVTIKDGTVNDIGFASSDRSKDGKVNKIVFFAMLPS